MWFSFDLHREFERSRRYSLSIHSSIAVRTNDRSIFSFHHPMFVSSFLMISDFAPAQILFDLSKKTIKVNENPFVLHTNKRITTRKSSRRKFLTDISSVMIECQRERENNQTSWKIIFPSFLMMPNWKKDKNEEENFSPRLPTRTFSSKLIR